MGIRIITGPTSEPVSLSEAKAQCRVDGSTEDTLISGYITAAREWCEKVDWRVYLTQTIELWLHRWPDERYITLPKPPLQSVTKVEYYDDSHTLHTLNSANWYVSQAEQPGKLHLRLNSDWPTEALREMEAICVTYVAGWSAAANVPQRIKQAILLIVGYWYENREAAINGMVSREIEFSAKALIGIDRVGM